MKTVFVTGTDTGVGKTFVSSALVRALRATGKTVTVLKPVASGCEQTATGWQNEDALALMAAAQNDQSYASVNPFALPPAIAPHIAAEESGVELSVAGILTATAATRTRADDVLLVEGAGGFLVPLNTHERFSDLALALNAEIVLVVAMRLGCINHALLSAEAIRARGLKLAGWVANSPQQEMSRYQDNLAYLHQHLPAPCLGEIGWQASAPEQLLAGAAAVLAS